MAATATGMGTATVAAAETESRGLRGRIAGVVLASALVLIGLLVFGAFRSAASEANNKLRAQTTLQLAGARVDLSGYLTRSDSQLSLSRRLLRPKAATGTRALPVRLGAPTLVRRGRSYWLERDLVGQRRPPLVRLHERLRLSAALLDAIGKPKVDPGAVSVVSRHGVVVAGDKALLGSRVPAGGSTTLAGRRYSVGSTPLAGNGRLQVLVPEAKIRAQLMSTRWRLLGGGALVLLAFGIGMYLLGRPLWRALGEVIRAADDDNSTDELTELTTPRAFRLALAFELERSKRTDKPVSLVLLDLDDFEEIGSNLGHPAGDSALRSFADVISEALGEDGLASRVGRDEFALLLPQTELPAAARVAERVRVALEEADIRYGHAVFRRTASLGVATSRGATVPQHVLQTAEEALSRAKAAGKNRVQLAAPLQAVPGTARRLEPAAAQS